MLGPHLKGIVAEDFQGIVQDMIGNSTDFEFYNSFSNLD
jgi:hypothetical protein